MSDTGTLPSGDAAVFALFEMFALAFAFEGTSMLLAGGDTRTVILAYGVAVTLFVGGIKWAWLKSKIGPRLGGSLVRVANDARFWFVALLVVFGLIGGQSLLLTQRSSSRAARNEVARSEAISPLPDVAAAPVPTPTPSPKPWQSFAENGYMGQVFVHEIQQNPIPGPHKASIIATDASHQFAKMLLGWLQGSWTTQGGWTIITHGQPDAFIGEPSEYALDDGITIRARADNVDAETLRLAFRVMGLNVHRVILPDSDTQTTYPIVEIGNVPADQR
jgi:hypothetical protein